MRDHHRISKTPSPILDLKNVLSPMQPADSYCLKITDQSLHLQQFCKNTWGCCLVMFLLSALLQIPTMNCLQQDDLADRLTSVYLKKRAIIQNPGYIFSMI